DSAVHDSRPREVLPIPDRPVVGLTTYAATDPDAVLPPIERLRPPSGAPNVLIVLLDDVGFGASSAFGGPVQMATAGRGGGAGVGEGGGGRVALHAVPYVCDVRSDAGGVVVGSQPSLGRVRQHHGDGNGCAGLQHHAPEHEGDVAGDAAAERLLDRDVRQEPR